MNINHSQGGYPLKVSLSPAAIAFLESKYPTVDPELGVVHLVEEAMQRAKHTAAAKVQVLEHPAYAIPSPSPSSGQNVPAPKPTEPWKQPPEAISSQTQLPPNLIGTLQEHCQQASLPLPEYQIEAATEGFTCQVSAAGKSASGFGANKKTAKANAARALIVQLPDEQH